MEALDNLEPFPETKTRQRTESGRSISRPGSAPPDPPGLSPSGRSSKKQKLNQVMNLFQGRSVEIYTEELNQSKLPEANVY